MSACPIHPNEWCTCQCKPLSLPFCSKHGTYGSAEVAPSSCPTCVREQMRDLVEACHDAELEGLRKETILTKSTTFGDVYAEATQDPNYKQLKRVLDMALVQAARGKGLERHGKGGEPFEQQKIVAFGLTLRSIDGNLFQAAKKAFEAKDLKLAAAIRELLGAINYLAGAILILEHLNKDDATLVESSTYTRTV